MPAGNNGEIFEPGTELETGNHSRGGGATGGATGNSSTGTYDPTGATSTSVEPETNAIAGKMNQSTLYIGGAILAIAIITFIIFKTK